MFDPTKPVQTREGRPVRILCTDMKGTAKDNILALVDDGSKEIPYRYYQSGKLYVDDTCLADLINVPVKTSTFNILYENMYVGSRQLNNIDEVRKTVARSINQVKGFIEIVLVDGEPTETIFHKN